MNDTCTLAPAWHQAARPETPVGPAEVSRRQGGRATPRAVVVTRDERKRLRRDLEPKSKANPHLVDDIGLEPEAAGPFAGHGTANGFLRLLGSLGTLAARWKMSGRMRRDGSAIPIDDLSEGQLRELGISRVARRMRWLDGCETQFLIDFEYRIDPDVSRESERYRMYP
ncbi:MULTISPECIES: hypothetical protein [unclassified Sinorhizobium]|uniref:hypothetical protein n=1 Tax=unclassified Sinorhizobium TaxID=2613772 RepID=UPI0024C3BD83|nr:MULTISPECIES: hypothetical protein [unclassified Sinorhizobium]MDK1373431.1 hypothetical protein [Sinorhizobium sp. 6-70]MDK1481266.1 hypothetical protein [Sinorhizobium sp. 6-117]